MWRVIRFMAGRVLGAITLLTIVGCSSPNNRLDIYQMDVNSWQYLYFGRFALKLPFDTEIYAIYKPMGYPLVLSSKNGKYQLVVDVEERISKLKAGSAADIAGVFEQKVALKNDGVLLVSKLYDVYSFYGFFLTDRNTMFTMAADPIISTGLGQAIDKMQMLSGSIYFRTPHEAPPPGAFAVEAGYSTLEPEKWAEQVSMGAQIVQHPGTYITFDTQGIDEPEDTLLKRYERSVSELSVINHLAEFLGKTKVLRKRKLEINGISAEELLIKAEVEGKVLYQFRLEYVGTPNSNRKPYLVLELGTHEIGSDFKSDEEALMFWDEVVSSLKPLA